MLWLALDTSTFMGSVAVWRAGRVVASRCERVTTHSERLLLMAEAALAECDAGPADVNAIACGAGPGSFTGLRIGMSTAKGLCFALDKPLYAVSSLAALAVGALPHVPADARILACLDAHRDEVFVGLFAAAGDLVRALAPERVLAPEDVPAYLGNTRAYVVGDGAVRYAQLVAGWGTHVTAAPQTPSAGAVATLAAVKPKSDDVATTVPTYIRVSEAELKLGKS